MKVGINGSVICVPDPGGIARVATEITKSLHKVMDVELFSHKKSKKVLEDISINSTGFMKPSRKFSVFWEQTILPIQASRANIDILYSPTPYCPAVPTNFPCTITIHDVSSIKGYSSKWYNQFEKIVLPRMIDRADHVITVSEFSKKEIGSTLGIPSSEIYVVPNGVSDFFLNSNNHESNLDLPDEYILYVGSLGERKNISGLFKSFRYIKTQYDLNHKLVLIGPEHDPTNTKDIDSELVDSIQDSLLQLGYVSQADLKESYISADVFVFPSLYEGFGIPPLEAMACRTPVVSSNRAAMPEILGNAAVFSNPENHMEFGDLIYDVISNESIRNELVCRGRNRAVKYTWERSAKMLASKLKNMV